MIEYIKNIDTQLFLFLNDLHCKPFDFLMWWISDKYIWIPLYAFFLFLLIKKYKTKSIIYIIAIILLIIITDQLSVNLFKNTFERYRPTHNLEIKHLVHTVNNYKGGKFGFISSHASNTAGLATILFILLRNKYFRVFVVFWAILVSYSRIYLGVHYPADITCGLIFGFICGLFVYYLTVIFNNIFKIKILKE